MMVVSGFAILLLEVLQRVATLARECGSEEKNLEDPQDVGNASHYKGLRHHQVEQTKPVQVENTR